MKTLYLDLFSGVSGDMFVGALMDLGVDSARLARELNKLDLEGYHLHIARREKSGIVGTKFDVHLEEHEHEHGSHGHHHHHDHGDHDHHHEHGGDPHHHGHEHGHGSHDHEDSRNFSDIQKLIRRSRLSSWVKTKAIAVFARIAAAEGKIHGRPADEVHFHEVGAVDSIVDIVGACIALELLGKPRVVASAVNEGVGWVDCAHGRFPVPAPATLAILGARGIGVTQCDEPHELVTPTGAALIAEFAEQFGPMNGLVAQQIGFGLGTRENRTRPNVLRAILGTAPGSQSKIKNQKSKTPGTTAALDWETDTIAVLETNLDDINAEVLGGFVEKAFAAGALDVFHTPIQMKKNRPGVLLTVLCAAADADRFSEMVLRETTAFGVRRHLAERRKLRREFRTVKTPFGNVTVKIGTLGGDVVQASPEFESCRQASAKAKVPLKHVYEAALRSLKA